MQTRGSIRNRDQAGVLRDFTGLLYANDITPTDIDGFIDFGDIAFVFIELKYKNSVILRGQELALERLCDRTGYYNKRSLCIVAEHEGDGDIDVARCRTVRVRENREWRLVENETVKQTIDNWLVCNGLGGYVKHQPSEGF